jgi:hypothetical protein
MMIPDLEPDEGNHDQRVAADRLAFDDEPEGRARLRYRRRESYEPDPWYYLALVVLTIFQAFAGLAAIILWLVVLPHYEPGLAFAECIAAAVVILTWTFLIMVLVDIGRTLRAIKRKC